MQANSTGQEFLANVIFQESWFNITGVNGGNFFDGAGVGATTTKRGTTKRFVDWDNRTVRLVWRETGPDASEGEEFPDATPSNKTPPLRWPKKPRRPDRGPRNWMDAHTSNHQRPPAFERARWAHVDG